MEKTQIALDTEALKRLAYAVINDAIVDANKGTGRMAESAVKFLRGEIGYIRSWLDCLTGVSTEAMMDGIKAAIANGKIGHKARPVRRESAPIPRTSRMMIPDGDRMVSLSEVCKKEGIPYTTLYSRLRKNPGKDLAYLLSIGRPPQATAGATR